jgi:hypothetical protein
MNKNWPSSDHPPRYYFTYVTSVVQGNTIEINIMSPLISLNLLINGENLSNLV